MGKVEWSRTYYLKNAERLKLKAITYRETHQDWYKEYHRKYNKAYAHRAKLEILAFYSNGDMCCARCGTNDVDVLCIDHINGGGNRQRLESKRVGDRLYFWLKKMGFPEGYQILCMNCNWKKRIQEGC